MLAAFPLSEFDKCSACCCPYTIINERADAAASNRIGRYVNFLAIVLYPCLEKPLTAYLGADTQTVYLIQQVGISDFVLNIQHLHICVFSQRQNAFKGDVMPE